MSIQWVVKTWNNARVAGRPLIVLLALASRANVQGAVQITASDLQHQCRMTYQQCTWALEQLVLTKHIEIIGPDTDAGRLAIYLLPKAPQHNNVPFER
jgi:hypothetical protein